MPGDPRWDQVAGQSGVSGQSPRHPPPGPTPPRAVCTAGGISVLGELVFPWDKTDSKEIRVSEDGLRQSGL